MADFDRIVVLNLDRRPDRLAAFYRGLPADWLPAETILRVPGVDGLATGAPVWWQETLGAWGCYRGHLRIWEDALAAGVDRLLVFEDDAIFCGEFAAKLQRVMDTLPDDWDQLYLGGEYLRGKQNPVVHTQDVLVRASHVNRTQAYAIRRSMLADAYVTLSEPHVPIEHTREQHIDHRLGRMHDSRRWNVYAPWRFLVGQRRSISDVLKPPMQAVATHWWNEYPIDEPEAVPCS